MYVLNSLYYENSKLIVMLFIYIVDYLTRQATLQSLSALSYSALHLTLTENSYTALSCYANNTNYNQLEELIDLQELKYFLILIQYCSNTVVH